MVHHAVAANFPSPRILSCLFPLLSVHYYFLFFRHFVLLRMQGLGGSRARGGQNVSTFAKRQSARASMYFSYVVARRHYYSRFLTIDNPVARMRNKCCIICSYRVRGATSARSKRRYTRANARNSLRRETGVFHLPLPNRDIVDHRSYVFVMLFAPLLSTTCRFAS